MNDLLNKELDAKGILIAAHRGVSGGSIIENTVKGFIAAHNQGADIVEMDVVKTRDNKLVCIHDGMERRLFYLDWRYTPLHKEKTVMRRHYYSSSLMPLPEHINRFDDVLESLKGLCLINVDRCWNHFDLVFEAVLRHNMADQIIFKSPPKEIFYKQFENRSVPFMFMPKVNDIAQIATAESAKLNLVGFEITFKDMASPLAEHALINRLRLEGKLLWVNMLNSAYTSHLYAGCDDNTSLLECPDNGWGKIIDRGFNVLQTDWPAALYVYLAKKGLRQIPGFQTALPADCKDECKQGLSNEI
jgi:glycerophosphoryl diester phosphodiesterase